MTVAVLPGGFRPPGWEHTWPAGWPRLPLLLLGISAVSFVLLNLAPGDPAEIVLRQRNPGQLPSPAAVAAMRIELGLDASLPVRYVRWMSQALAGDMGRSYVTEQPVAGQLARRTVPTALLTAAALAMALLVAVPMGILSARRRGTPVDALARLAALVGAAAPSYALAYGLIILFAVKLSWLPALGYGSAAQVVLPAVALSLCAHGPADAADTRQYAGNTGAGLHPDGAGQGTV